MSGIPALGDLADKKHSNDGRYAKRASAWHGAIVAARGRNWTGGPLDPEAGTVADLIRVWSSVGEVSAGAKGASRDNIILADIDGDDKDDYLVVGTGGVV
ncbi:hypothetical protein BJX63DRAFT_438230 [Aspergillus granulosus]|uniref:VCBS repeat-containing protein n=1 Tax=Aspergillus granulosus TaxID=176169 RepID=A0ABR4GSK9_9EURO